MDCVVSSQPLGDERNSLRGKELAHEPCIPVSDGGHFDSLEYIGAAKCLGDESSSIASKLHDLIDDQLHCMASASRTSVARAASWQQNMIHAARKQIRVVHANGNAGT